ncbi:MAG: DUF3168 domain-containing protein [Patescibacteria group bacterium]|nr:DUF3168 domain-containing protein [Patescibacteria group bacterium]
MIEDAIFTVLSTNAGVVAIVAARIYPALLPQEPIYPALAYTFISESTLPAMGVDMTSVRRRLQVSCWDLTMTGAQALADAVTTALSRYQATVTGTWGSITIDDIYREGIHDLFDEQARKFHRVVDFEVVYEE